MKNLKEYLNEGLLTRKISTKAPIKYKPKDWDELFDITKDLLKKGITDLNCIDVSELNSIAWLFSELNAEIPVEDIDISDWDVSNIQSMNGTFSGCEKFNADLSKWDVSNVDNAYSMFYDCEKFDSDLSKWKVSNIKSAACMFGYCKKFNSDLSNWNVSDKVKTATNMFMDCDTLEKNNKIPAWYKG